MFKLQAYKGELTANYGTSVKLKKWTEIKSTGNVSCHSTTDNQMIVKHQTLGGAFWLAVASPQGVFREWLLWGASTSGGLSLLCCLRSLQQGIRQRLSRSVDLRPLQRRPEWPEPPCGRHVLGALWQSAQLQLVRSGNLWQGHQLRRQPLRTHVQRQRGQIHQGQSWRLPHFLQQRLHHRQRLHVRLQWSRSQNGYQWAQTLFLDSSNKWEYALERHLKCWNFYAVIIDV